MVVTKLDYRGRPVARWVGEVLHRDDQELTLAATFSHAAVAGTFCTIEPGDRFTEHYFFHRWYAIWEIRAAGTGGTLKGWYCNVEEPPVVDGDELRFRDLILDVDVAPDGRCRVLDEDDFAAARAALPSEVAAAAERAVSELLELIANRRPPFDQINSRVRQT